MVFQSSRYSALIVATVLVFSVFSTNMSVNALTYFTDQQCSTVGGGYLNGIGAYLPAGQTFTPTQTSLVGFSINVYSTNGVPTPMTAQILSGSSGGVGGTIVSSVSFSIPASFGSPSGDWFFISFPSGVRVTPGSSYTLNLTDNLHSSGIKWNRCTLPYAGGCGYSSGSCGLASWAFIEYAGDFSIALTTTSIAISQGGSGSAAVMITSLSNFTSAVTLSFAGVAGVTASFGTNPVIPPSGGVTSSTLNINVGGGVAAGPYTLTITSTSGPLTHFVTLGLTVTPAVPDFTITPSQGTVSLPQGGASTAAVITITSTNGFSAPVTLTPSWVGAAPTGVTFTLASPLTPPAGSGASAILIVTATPSASVGSFTIRVQGASGVLSHNAVPDLALQVTAVSVTSLSTTTLTPPKCLIATATFGSELAPEVQVLRDFRDDSILKTQAGSQFMVAFNAWYYSFSPQVASHLNEHGFERTLMKGALYPLVGILFLTAELFRFTSSYPEVAALLSGLLASSLIGGLYLGLPISMLRARMNLRRRRTQKLIEKLLAIIFALGIGGFVLGELVPLVPILALSTSAIVLATLTLSATLVSGRIASKLRTTG